MSEILTLLVECILRMIVRELLCNVPVGTLRWLFFRVGLRSNRAWMDFIADDFTNAILAIILFVAWMIYILTYQNGNVP
ncbi:hypothetical protein BWI93_19385 [Siphonobacter sp. BAB-5385]|nr:hypothetical protein BWI93_19385 [Siphonobacter sp. BAB-5385]PMD97203.1 hypothetical protein BWI97_09045 [Siphonobacter sp. BAB-5405]